MSIEIMSKVWRYADSSLGELLVLLAMADHANDKGFCWPGVENLAMKSRLSERQTRYIIRALEKKGYVKTLFNEGPKGCNMYQIIVGEGAKTAPLGEGAVCDTKGGNPRQEGGQPIAPESSRTITKPPVQGELLKLEPVWFNVLPPECHDLWEKWMKHRRKMKKPATEWTEFFNNQAEWLKQYTPAQIKVIINKSIINGYTGLFEPRGSNGAKSAYELKLIMDAKQKIATDLKNRFTHECPTGLVWGFNEKERVQYTDLMREIKELNKQIAEI